MKDFILQHFTIKEERYSEDLHATIYRISHNKTGAQVAAIINEDKNKVFNIGFRTAPSDDTGVPHILEHSVLCGSKNFPIKDPFIELAKGSLNTFLNAMTYPDRTVYPVASCNDADFQNLMHIYLDAVFYPNIYKEENIFKQEGWHYELESLDAPLTVNGVVYNEMKGAYSNPDDVISSEIMFAQYPDTTYGVESGGKPESIKELTYDDFLNFHSTLYHPTNSYIYLYGKLDLWEKLAFIHNEYLSNFDHIDIDTTIKMQAPFDAIKYVEIPYPILKDESCEDKTYLAYTTTIGTSLDVKKCVTLQILDYVLCSAPGAPLKKALIDLEMGSDVFSTYETGILQPYFSIVAKDSCKSKKQLFVDTIEKTLKSLIKDGLDAKSLSAAIQYFEFKYREADYGRFPKGLVYGLQMVDSWNYDSESPFIHLELNSIYSNLKEEINTSYYEDFIQENILDNLHKTILEMYPQQGLTEETDAKLAKELELKKQGMTTEELQKIIDDHKKLTAYQEKADSKEDILKIPLLKRSDLTKDSEKAINEMKMIGDIKYLTHPIETNGIAYFRFIFDIKNVPQELFPYVNLLKSSLGQLDTKKHSYGELFNEILLVSGGLETVTNIYTKADDYDSAIVTFEFKAKVLFENLNKVIPFINELIFDTIFDDKKRMKEILSEIKSRMQSQLVGAGHSVAANRAMSYFSKVNSISDSLNGLAFYQLVSSLEENFDAKYEEIITAFEKLTHIIFRKENLLVDITSMKEGIDLLEKEIPSFANGLYDNEIEVGSFEPVLKVKNEAFKTSGQVQYVCRAGNFYNKGLAYTGALKVLKVIMGYEYLWTQVRVKGGAYGCMCSFGKTGDSYFVSYRDPNLVETINIYENAAKAVEDFVADDRTMTQYVIGAISELDVPKTPSNMGLYSLGMHLTGKKEEDVQEERNEILNCSVEDINKLSHHIKAFMSDEIICVVGNASKIEDRKDLFMDVKQLL